MTKREQERDQRLAAIIFFTAVQAVVGTVTVRDVLRRRPDEVRGPKLLWLAWGGSNNLGSAAYWLLGRKRS